MADHRAARRPPRGRRRRSTLAVGLAMAALVAGACAADDPDGPDGPDATDATEEQPEPDATPEPPDADEDPDEDPDAGTDDDVDAAAPDDLDASAPDPVELIDLQADRPLLSLVPDELPGLVAGDGVERTTGVVARRDGEGPRPDTSELFGAQEAWRLEMVGCDESLFTTWRPTDVAPAAPTDEWPVALEDRIVVALHRCDEDAPDIRERTVQQRQFDAARRLAETFELDDEWGELEPEPLDDLPGATITGELGEYQGVTVEVPVGGGVLSVNVEGPDDDQRRALARTVAGDAVEAVAELAATTWTAEEQDPAGLTAVAAGVDAVEGTEVDRWVGRPDDHPAPVAAPALVAHRTGADQGGRRTVEVEQATVTVVGWSTPRPDLTAGLLAAEWPDLDAIDGLELPGTMHRAGAADVVRGDDGEETSRASAVFHLDGEAWRVDADAADATRAEDVLRDVVTVLRER